MPDDNRGQVWVQVVDVTNGREIGRMSNLAENLRDRIDDIKKAIVAGSETVAGSLGSIKEAPGWSLGEVSASFGVTLTAEAGVILSKASAGATFEVTVTFERSGR